MASQKTIIVSDRPRGVFIEGLLDTGNTPKPGQCVSIVNTALSEGKHTYEVWNGAADGELDEVIVVLENALLGKTVDDAYAAGDRFFGYIPQPGEELLVLFKNVAGTADDVSIGDKLIIDDGTGKVIVTTGSPEMEPFKALEALTDPTADTLIHVRYTGH